MLPNFRLAALFAKLAKQHGSKVLHGGSVELLTKDLGDALRRQKKVITDPDMNTLETAYEALPIIAEVKILTLAVSKKLDIDTKGKPAIAVLEEIVRLTEERGSTTAKEIKNTLDWTRDFFAQPEIQEILQTDMVEIETPHSWTDVKGFGKSAMQGVQRVAQEISRLQDFLQKAKDTPNTPPPKSAEPPKSIEPPKNPEPPKAP